MLWTPHNLALLGALRAQIPTVRHVAVVKPYRGTSLIRNHGSRHSCGVRSNGGVVCWGDHVSYPHTTGAEREFCIDNLLVRLIIVMVR